jgi:hypothetical protein
MPVGPLEADQAPLSGRDYFVERFFAWLEHKRGLLNRQGFHPENFLGFVQLSTMILLPRLF